MKILGKFQLENIGLFDKAEFDLSRRGISVIHGWNKDASKNTPVRDVNAAGKSQFFNALANLMRGTTPIVHAAKTKQKARLDLFRAGGSSTLSLSNGQSTFVIQKKLEGTSFKYRISKNGTDTKIRTAELAEKKIADFFQYTDEEFFTLYYIDSRVPSRLQLGKPTDRLEFFINLFRLHSYDDMRSVFNSMLRDLKSKKVILTTEIDRELAGLGDGGTDITKLEERLDSLKRTQDAASDAYSKLNAEILKTKQLLSLKSSWLDFVDLSADLELDISIDNVLHTAKHVSQSIKTIKANQAKHKDYLVYKQALASYESKREELEDELPALGMSAQEAKAWLRKYDQLKAEARDCPDVPDFDAARYKTLQARCGKLEDTETLKASIQDTKIRLNQLRSDTESLEAQLSSLESLSGQACPTCTQKVTNAVKDALRKSLEKALDAREDESDKVAENLKIQQRDLKLVQELESLEARKREFDEAQATIKTADKIRLKLKSLDAKKSQVTQFIEVSSKLSLLVKPDHVDAVSGDTDADLDKLTQWMLLFKLLSPALKLLAVADFRAISKQRLDGLTAKLADISSKLEKCNSVIPSLSSQITTHKMKSDRREELLARKKMLDSELKDLPIVESLVNLYSSKGLKMLIVKNIAAMVERNMNKFAPLIFSEKITFKFLVGPNKFDILFEKQHGKSKVVNDVRALSGGESRSFSFLLPLAVLPMIPAQRRLNIMILDEPTVNLGQNRVELFTRSFIPKLSTVIPHVIVITPQMESYPNAKVFTVVKEKGKSQLIEGTI